MEWLRMKISEEEAKMSSCNSGICFVVFKDSELAHKMQDKKWIDQARYKMNYRDLISMNLN